ncbi:MAG: hypothetical protein HKL80_09925 [Acidimicrobiales bacterium]|nr:hypothetical protein [Acidimicrobiales bacterium]
MASTDLEQLGLLDGQATGVINGVAFSIGLLSVVVGCSLMILTFIPNRGDFSIGLVFVLFFMAFPLSIWTMILKILRSQRFGDPFIDGVFRPFRPRKHRNLPIENLPIWAFVALVILWIVCLLNCYFVMNRHDLAGQPSYNSISHQYTADNHGTIIFLSQAQYRRAVSAQNRLFLSGAVGFTALTVAATLDEIVRRHRSSYVRRNPMLAKRNKLNTST